MMNDLGLKRALALAEVIESKRQVLPHTVAVTAQAMGAARRAAGHRRPPCHYHDEPADALNALNGKVLRELKETLGAVGKNRLRAVIITGEAAPLSPGRHQRDAGPRGKVGRHSSVIDFGKGF